MKNVFKLIALFIIVSLFNACVFNSGIEGSGNVTVEERTITEEFNSISVAQGIDVIYTQENDIKLKAEMDDNLHELLVTKVKDNTLKIRFKENIGRRKSSKVFLSALSLKEITTSSSADFSNVGTIQAQEIELNASSGSDITIKIDAKTIDCSISSGSDIELEGSCDKLIADCSSGADLEAESLIAKKAHVNASSGAGIEVYASESLEASASSGADVVCAGNPEDRNIEKSSGGRVVVK
jgi:hypothetical protein